MVKAYKYKALWRDKPVGVPPKKRLSTQQGTPNYRGLQHLRLCQHLTRTSERTPLPFDESEVGAIWPRCRCQQRDTEHEREWRDVESLRLTSKSWYSRISFGWKWKITITQFLCTDYTPEIRKFSSSRIYCGWIRLIGSTKIQTQFFPRPCKLGWDFPPTWMSFPSKEKPARSVRQFASASGGCIVLPSFQQLGQVSVAADGGEKTVGLNEESC